MKTKFLLSCFFVLLISTSCKTNNEPKVSKLGDITLSSPDDLEEFDLDYINPQTSLSFQWVSKDTSNVAYNVLFSLNKDLSSPVTLNRGISLKCEITHFQLDSILGALGVKEYKRGKLYWAIEGKRGTDIIKSEIRSMKLFRFYKPFVDPRDGEIYRVCKVIDKLTGDYAVWLADNIRATKYSDGTPISGVRFYVPTGSTDVAYIKSFGGYYTWSSAVRDTVSAVAGDTIQGIAPKGWHIPSKLEWDFLLNSVDQGNGPGTELKDPTLWDPTSTNKGTNSIGFNMAGSGYCWTMSNNNVEALSTCYFWTATAPQVGDLYPWNPPVVDYPTQGVTYGFNKNDFGAALYPYPRVRGFSVRCVLN